MRGCNSGCHGLRLVPSYRCSITTRHPAGRYLARARPAVSVRLRRSSEWGGHTHPPLHRASAPKTLDYIYCLAVRPFASSLYRFQVCQRAAGLTYPPLRLGSCLGFWSLLARCSSPHPRSVFHFRFLVHSWLVRLRGPASVQRSLARYPARPEGIHFMHAPVWVRRMGQPRFARLRVVCISHSTSDFVPPCMQIQIRVYSTDFPVFPTCWIFPSFSNAERYRVAVASETCSNFSTSSLVILPFVFRASMILSNFFRFRS